MNVNVCVQIYRKAFHLGRYNGRFLRTQLLSRQVYYQLMLSVKNRSKLLLLARQYQPRMYRSSLRMQTDFIIGAGYRDSHIHCTLVQKSCHYLQLELGALDIAIGMQFAKQKQSNFEVRKCLQGSCPWMPETLCLHHHHHQMIDIPSIAGRDLPLECHGRFAIIIRLASGLVISIGVQDVRTDLIISSFERLVQRDEIK